MPNRISAALASALSALLLTLLWTFRPFSPPDWRVHAFTVRLELSAPKPVTALLLPITEAGMQSAFIRTFEISAGAVPQTIVLPLANVDTFGLGIVWKRGEGPLRLIGARIMADDGRTVRELPVPQWKYCGPAHDFAREPGDTAPEILSEKPFLSTAFPELRAEEPPPRTAPRIALTFALLFAGLLACARLLATLFPRALSASAAFCRRRPRAAIAVASVLSVLAACHPVIFFGKSFVSPNNGAQMFYSMPPTVAGAPLEPMENTAGSDFGAMMYQNMPNTAVQHRAIFTDGEMPFWNRGTWFGTTLLGQLQTMLGDPLHWLPLATGGSALAWDAKFILARIAFAVGIGFLALAVGRHAGVSVLLAASAPWIGFFTYRACHPAAFTMCYAPWILIAWLGAVRAECWRGARGPALLLLFADWWVLSSGTAKEASAMLVFLNLAGGLAMLLHVQPWRMRAAKLALMALASLIFLLVSAPQWLVFLDALKKANTAYEALPACQIQPSLAIGLFDDIFYRQLCDHESAFNPCANLLVLAGLAWLFCRPRTALADRTAAAFTAIGVLVACFAFGVISPVVLKSLPFLSTVYHFDNTCSCVLIVLCFPLAALGLKRCADDAAKPGWLADWAFTLGATALLVMAYFGFLHAAHRVGFNMFAEQSPPSLSRRFAVLAPLLLAAFAAFAPSLRATLIAGPWRAPGAVLLAASLAVIHFRHGQWLETNFDTLTFNPKTRFDLRTTQSPALAWLAAAQSREPGRAIGLDDAIVPGTAMLHGIEDISGADALRVGGTRELIEAIGIPLVGWHAFIPARLARVLHTRLDFLNVRHCALEKNPTVAAPDGFPVAFDGDMAIYESPTAWPRAFFTDAAFPAASAKDVANVLANSDGRPFAAISPQVIPHLHLPNAATTARHSIAATAYRLTANSTEFAITATGPGIAVLHETFSPDDIEVTVDGEPSVALRANHAFRAVPILTPGRHVVRFTFVPAVWGRALTLCAAGLGLLALSVFALRGKSRA